MSDSARTAEAPAAPAAAEFSDRVRHAMAVSLRGCDELLPEADWLK